MVGWHHQLSGHEFEQALGGGDGQGSLECCSPWGHKESDTTEDGTTARATPTQTKNQGICELPNALSPCFLVNSF